MRRDPQHDEHYRDFLEQTGGRRETVVRMPDGLLHLEEYIVEDDGTRWVFTDMGTPIFVGVQ